jgi:hypothetical protein
VVSQHSREESIAASSTAYPTPIYIFKLHYSANKVNSAKQCFRLLYE